MSALLLAIIVAGAEARPLPTWETLCSLAGGAPRFSIARTQDVVAASEVIVRATALGEVPPPVGTPRPDLGYVAFTVDEVLRGTEVPDTLRFSGVIRPEDAIPPELYEEEVPHRSYIRRWGGDCMAATYQAGGQYLLLLQRSEARGTLDPYWTVLAPTNNQVRRGDDRWVQWVRAEIVRNPRSQ